MKKLKRTSVGNIERENERDQTYEAKNPKIDLSRTHGNYHIIAPPQSYLDFINERIASLNLKRKVRSDAIYMNTFVLSSGHEFFENMPLDRQSEFFEDCVKFFADKYGAENIISAVVHMDETTPHLHLNLVPITGGKLCSKDLFSPKKLSQLQTELAEVVGKKWGLKRGKIGSTARHVEAAEYTANETITNARASAEATKKQAEQYLDSIVQSVESTADKPIPTKRKHAEDEIKTLRAQNAALQKSLDIKSKDAADLFEQLQRAERLGKGKDSAFRMVNDMIAAYPDEFDELLKKSREKKATPQYKANSRGNDRGGK
ncbi:MAG TPA: plasmid recombination protein [Firmicutes bacterium]|nr:plasmid recombination protein [Bacillota bacterium]